MVFRIVSHAAAAAVAAILTTPSAQAGPIGEGCVEDFWMWQGLRSVTRMICDGDRKADASWLRVRGFFDDRYYVPVTCSRYSCSGGHWVDELEVIDRYIVTDATVLPDEPGYIESAEPRTVTG